MVYWLEFVGLLIVFVSTYLLQYALTNSTDAFQFGEPAVNIIATGLMALFVGYALLLLYLISRAIWKKHSKRGSQKPSLVSRGYHAASGFLRACRCGGGWEVGQGST